MTFIGMVLYGFVSLYRCFVALYECVMRDICYGIVARKVVVLSTTIIMERLMI